MRAAFFDIDGTLTKVRVWRGLMDYFKKRGLRRFTHIGFGIYHIPLLILHRFGLVRQSAFRVPWAKHLPWFFRGYTLAGSQDIWEWVVEEFLADNWRPDVRALLDEHRNAGDLIVLVSASPLPLAQRIALELGAHHVAATAPQVRNGKYTGRVSSVLCMGENKPILVRELLEQHGVKVDLEKSYAYADSLGDVPLLEMVGNPVAVYPDDELRPVAEKRSWNIFP